MQMSDYCSQLDYQLKQPHTCSVTKCLLLFCSQQLQQCDEEEQAGCGTTIPRVQAQCAAFTSWFWFWLRLLRLWSATWRWCRCKWMAFESGMSMGSNELDTSGMNWRNILTLPCQKVGWGSRPARVQARVAGSYASTTSDSSNVLS